MNNVLKQLQDSIIVPVVVIENLEDAINIADAIIKGGINCAEITFRTACAKEAIKKISESYPNMLVGAGTVITIEQVKEAVSVGAKFIVSPGFDEEIVDYCLKNNITVIPGCITPTEVTKAIKKGLEVLKFFPAEQAGGLDMIKSMCAPFTQVKFMPTGGISPNNLKDYLEFNKIVACGGSWMVKKDLIDSKNFEEITNITKEAVNIAKSVRN